MKKIMFIILCFFIMPLVVLADYDINCKYNNNDYTTFKNFAITYDNSGLSFVIGSSKISVCQPSGCDNSSTTAYNGTIISFSTFHIDEFLDNYDLNDGCPSNMHIDDVSKSGTVYVYSHYVGDFQTTFNLVANNNTPVTDSDTGCLVSGAYCADYVKQDTNGNNVYIQLGRKDDGVNTEDTKYFAVSSDKDYKNYQKISFTDINNSVSLVYGGFTYTIPSTQIDRLYVKRGTFIDKKYFTLSLYDDDDKVYFLSYYDSAATSGIGNDYQNNTDIVNNNKGSEQEPQTITKFGFCDVYITDTSTGASTPNGTLVALKIVGYIIYVAKMLVPLLLIIMGSVDFAKATISNDEKAGKEAFTTLIKRIITGLIIFVIPTLLDLVISLIDEASDTLNDSNFSNCTDCLLDPLGDCQASIIQ